MFCQHPPSFFVWVCVIRTRLELIVSSPRNVLNTYLSTFNAGISIMVHQVKLMKFLMKMVNYFMSFFMLSNLIFYWQDHSETCYCCYFQVKLTMKNQFDQILPSLLPIWPDFTWVLSLNHGTRRICDWWTINGNPITNSTLILTFIDWPILD